jgi:phosphatidylinositol alpha-1,6-mannosyltransferase
MGPGTRGAGEPRLLLVSRKWPPAVGGMETYSVELAASLAERFRVDLRVLPGRDDGRPPSLMRVAWFVLVAMLAALREARTHPVAVFADPVLLPVALCHRLVAPRQRRIVVVYGLDLVYHRRRGLLPWCYRGFFALFRRWQAVFSAIVAISAHTAGIARDAGLREVTVVHPSLPLNALTSAPPTARPLPAAWVAARRRVLYFGRLVPRKGALWFAEQVMPELDAEVEFFVVGHATHPRLRQQLQHCPRTHSLGRIDSAELAALIRAADVVVMPNVATPEAQDVEGFGLAAIEATALGGRLLAARIDGIVDAVVDGVTGTLVPAGDAKAWIAAVRQALAEPRTEASVAATAAATRAQYSRARQAAGFAAVFGMAEAT